MARPKSVSSAVLVRIFREYCRERGATSPEEVRFSDLSRYASERGVDAPRYLFARDREVRAELEALRPAEDLDAVLEALSCHTLDVRALLDACGNDRMALAGRLQVQSAYWDRVYRAALSASDQVRSLRRALKEAEHRAALAEERADAARKKEEEAGALLEALKKRDRLLGEIIKTCVYPGAAALLLKRAGNPALEGITDLEAAAGLLIEWNSPREKVRALEKAGAGTGVAQEKKTERDGRPDTACDILDELWEEHGGRP